MRILTTTIAACCLLLLACTVRPPLTMDAAVASVAPVAAAADSVFSVQGSGTVVVAQSGQELALTFDIVWHGDSSFAAQFYGPMAMPLASIRSVTAMRWLVTAGDSQYTQHPSQRVSVGQGFVELPLTWANLLSALTFRYPCAAHLRGPPDSMFTDRKGAHCLWRSRRCGERNIDIKAVLDNKTDHLSEISYDDGETAGTRLIFGKFHDRRPKEIRFVSSDNNYFYVTYRALTVNSRKVRLP
ncbi:MAG TPA: hypothetical protein VKF42_10615 [Chitinivibrionales bacterium]|jgi:hypothetical protein|nr:hypothetical protein [Chitinivibrionales bacterium]